MLSSSVSTAQTFPTGSSCELDGFDTRRVADSAGGGRLDEDPLPGSGTFRPFGWAVQFDTDDDLTDYEFIAMVDGISNPDEVTLQQNTN